MSASAWPEWDEPLPTLAGRAWAFGLRLGATDILPARYARNDAATARRYLFSNIDPRLADRLEPDDVIVADTYVASPDDARPAAAALVAAGVMARVARDLEPALETAAADHGLVVVRLDAPAFIHTGDRVRIDFAATKLVNLSSGDRAAIRNLDETTRGRIHAILAARPRSR